MNYISKEFKQVINECFDYSDNYTRKCLLALNESDQNLVTRKLADQLYQSVVEKIDDIDFGDIPMTKGDVTKLPNYDKLVATIDLIKDLLVQYKQDTSSIDTIKAALDNVLMRKSSFELAYKVDVELPIVLYNTIVLAIISATSFLISVCVDFIKLPSSDDFNIHVDKVGLAKSKEFLLLNNLKKFNASCSKGEMDSVLDHLIKNGGKNMLGVVDTYAIMTGVVLTALALMIIPMMRELIYFFFYSRVRVSDYFDIQADLLQSNVQNIKGSDKLTNEEIKKVASKQESIVKSFRTIANTISVKLSTSEKKAQKDILDKSHKKKIDDVVGNELPDSAASALF